MPEWTIVSNLPSLARGPQERRGIWNPYEFSLNTGPSPGIRERTFASWCRKRRHLCVRTVDLFWFLRVGQRKFPSINKQWLRAYWEFLVRSHFEFLSSDIEILADSGSMRMTMTQRREYARTWYRHPGRWDYYYERCRSRYFKERSLHRFVLSQWAQFPLGGKRAVLRSRRFTDKQDTAYPDYFVVFRRIGKIMPWYGFVEVKGKRESVRPSQQRFFPRLVKDNSQTIWLARLEAEERTTRWFRVGKLGDRFKVTPPHCP